MKSLEFSWCSETVIWTQQVCCSYCKNESLLRMNKHLRLLSFYKVANMLSAAQEQFFFKKVLPAYLRDVGCQETPRFLRSTNLMQSYQQHLLTITEAFFYHENKRKDGALLTEKTDSVYCLHRRSKIVTCFRSISPRQSHHVGLLQKARYRTWVK